MTRQQNSSSAAFSIFTASPGEEWTAGKKMTGVELHQKTNAETTVSLSQPCRPAEGSEVAAGRGVRCGGRYHR